MHRLRHCDGCHRMVRLRMVWRWFQHLIADHGMRAVEAEAVIQHLLGRLLRKTKVL